MENQLVWLVILNQFLCKYNMSFTVIQIVCEFMQFDAEVQFSEFMKMS